MVIKRAQISQIQPRLMVIKQAQISQIQSHLQERIVFTTNNSEICTSLTLIVVDCQGQGK